jgi:hypothetical protein
VAQSTGEVRWKVYRKNQPTVCDFGTELTDPVLMENTGDAYYEGTSNQHEILWIAVDYGREAPDDPFVLVIQPKVLSAPPDYDPVATGICDGSSDPKMDYEDLGKDERRYELYPPSDPGEHLWYVIEGVESFYCQVAFLGTPPLAQLGKRKLPGGTPVPGKGPEIFQISQLEVHIKRQEGSSFSCP